MWGQPAEFPVRSRANFQEAPTNAENRQLRGLLDISRPQGPPEDIQEGARHGLMGDHDASALPVDKVGEPLG